MWTAAIIKCYTTKERFLEIPFPHSINVHYTIGKLSEIQIIPNHYEIDYCRYQLLVACYSKRTADTLTLMDFYKHVLQAKIWCASSWWVLPTLSLC